MEWGISQIILVFYDVHREKIVQALLIFDGGPFVVHGDHSERGNEQKNSFYFPSYLNTSIYV